MARIAAAIRSALAAPAGPMAMAATEKPLGIWTMELERSGARERFGLDRDADHRHVGFGRHHAEKMGGAADACDDDFQSAVRRDAP